METTPSGNFFLQYGSLIGTIIASITALGIAIWGRWLRSLPFRPELKIVDLISRNQTPSLNLWRLVIKNIGNDTAKNVQVDIIEVVDDGKKLRKNFLPLPLRWTHLDKECRDILPDQTVYLDLFEHINRGPLGNIQHFVRFGTRYAQEIQHFCFLNPGKSKVKIKLFQENGVSFETTVDTDWDGTLLFDAKRKGGNWLWRNKNE